MESGIRTRGQGETARSRWFGRGAPKVAFHFLADTAERRGHAENLRRALTPGGTAIIATFAESGPTKCSGLDAMRYGDEGLSAEFPFLEMVESFEKTHTTPAGKEQRFLVGRMRLG